ncbi:hypothetical protein [Acidithiobacillus marinus]|uniref:hypothetical protein n=1 Tax=Acidithiobacillus marinus TaxID=187490 RepID=UPI00117B51BD|nr:hypothetical protein [Acidithiobacillus marinus]
MYIPSGPKGEHLFVVILGPKLLSSYGQQELYVIVPICSAIPNIEHECPLDPSCHPFLRHDSYADFSNAQIRNKSDLCEYVAKSLWRAGEDVSAAVLNRITESLFKSKRIPRYIKRDFL